MIGDDVMSIEEYKKLDPKFDEQLFLSKVQNMFIKYFSAVMLDKLDTVKHFVSDSVYQDGVNLVNEWKSRKARHMYDMLNAQDSHITSIEERDDAYVISVFLNSRYLDYYMDLETGKVTGDDQNRVTVPYRLELTKKKDFKKEGLIKKCPTCGASLLINNSGKCEYCGNTYNLEDYDFVITRMYKS